MSEFIIMFIFIILLVTLVVIYIKNQKKYTKFIKLTTITQESYQRYAKFYDSTVPQDECFDDKMQKIYTLIEVDKKRDIKKIAASSNCSYEECILKIRYLKNKRQIAEYHIDHVNGKLLPCTEEENVLLKKYKPFIYNNHLTISEISARLPGATIAKLPNLKEQVYNDLKQLYDSDLLNGIKLNEVDKEIIYYTVEKRKKEKDYISIRCENCGALNDVNRGSKTRCEYCDSIVEDTTIE